MQINYGPYIIKTHELDNKLSVQVVSDSGNVNMSEENVRSNDFPNGIHFSLSGSEKPAAKGLKKYSFGEYTFILGINNAGELFLFHSVQLRVGKKLIDGIDAINLAFLKDPTA